MQMLNFDSGRVLHQIAQIEMGADEIAELRRKASNARDRLRDSWHGDASAAYLGKLEEFVSLLEANESRLRRDAAVFRTKVSELMAIG